MRLAGEESSDKCNSHRTHPRDFEPEVKRHTTDMHYTRIEPPEQLQPWYQFLTILVRAIGAGWREETNQPCRMGLPLILGLRRPGLELLGLSVGVFVLLQHT